MLSVKGRKIIRRISVALGIFLTLMLLFTGMANIIVTKAAKGRLYNDISKVPENEVGLVLGTSKHVVGGDENPFFKYRIEAAAALYKSGKIKHIIVSGDNHIKYYNEPKDMQDALIKEGIPADAITLDYAGFRTLDSVVRCKEIFGQENFTIISQKFHNQRAVFLARKRGINAIGFNAKYVSFNQAKLTFLREYLARSKAVIDIYMLKKEPKFLGKEEPIEVG